MPVADLPKPVARPNPTNNTTMFQIFQNVQYNVVQHKKYVKEMTKLYKKLDENAFRESFKNSLQYLFTFGDTSANVDRVIQFVATFCTSLDDEEEFLMFIVDVIFNCQCVSGQSVRYRASQLLAAVLSALGEDASLDDDLCDKLLSSQMDRLQDTRGAVRCRAALALQRLQNPMETDDGVTRAYRFHMSCDPSSSVRRAIVMSIAKCIRNVPFVLERLCDVDEAVRRAAFLYVSAINVTQLRVRQRVLILKVGLTERSQRVRRVVEEILIPGWLSTFKGNIIDLLKAIRLDNAQDAKDSQYVAKKLLESLFKRLAISELLEWLPTDKTLRLIPSEKLNKETAWYWRHLAEHLQKIEDDETLEAVLPDLVVFTGYIKAIVESPCPSENEDPVGFSTRQYVLDELGSMLRVYDASDPTGRMALQSLITDALTGDYGPLSPEVIRAFVSALELAVPEVAQRVELIYGAISALRDPPEPEVLPPPPPQVDSNEVKIQKAKLGVSLNVAIEEQEEAVRDQNYALAAECKAKVEELQKQIYELNQQSAPQPPPSLPMSTIQEKKSDPDTLNKCLTILNSALDTPQLKSITPMLHMIFSELEVEIMQNTDILENALQTVALYSMLDKEFAKENKPFFFANLIDTSNERVVTIVLQCIVDVLCVHGARVFDDDSTESQDESKTKSKRNTYHSVDALNADGTLSESVLLMTPPHSTVIELLLKIMDSTCAAYRLIIVEGLCRLLYLGHIESPSIISRLLLLWFNPATVEEDMLRQTIGVFFQTFPTSVDSAQEQIQQAIVPTLRVLANAPSSSPLAEIDQEAVVRFLVSLSRINHDETDNQGATATLLCSYLVRRPNACEAVLACRMLALLAPPRDARAAAVLANMLRDLCLKLPDKLSCRYLTRYLGALEVTERSSFNKMSNTGIGEGTVQTEDTLSQIGRATSSLPQPIARSTHVVIDETVEEEVEINEDSPKDPVSAIAEEQPQSANKNNPKSGRQSSDSKSTSSSDTSRQDEKSSENADDNNSTADSDTSGASPVKKVKISKEKKKKLSLNRQHKKADKGKAVQSKDKMTDKKKEVQEKRIDKKQKIQEEHEKGVKRSRSQRYVGDIDRGQNDENSSKKQTPATPSVDFDASNVTLRRSSRSLQSSSSTDSNSSGKNAGRKPIKKKNDPVANKPSTRPNTRASAGSKGETDLSSQSLFEDSADETELNKPKKKNDPVANKPSTRPNTRASAGSKGETDLSSQSLFEDSADETELNKPKKKNDPVASKPSTRPNTRASAGSKGETDLSSQSLFEDSADETELHTIVYDKELEQSLLNDSNESIDNSKRVSRGSLTIPETPDCSDESESQSEPEIKKKNAKRKGKKK